MTEYKSDRHSRGGGNPVRLIPLRDLGRWTGGGTPSKSNPAFWVNGTVPWVSPKDMKVERVSSTEDYITEEAVENSATQKVAKGAVMVVVRSGILKHSLPVAIAEREVALNQDMKAVELKEGFMPEYVAWGIRASAQTILHACSKSGTTVQNIEMPKFLRHEIPVVSIEHQRCIVAELEAQLTRLDASVAALKRAQVSLKRYRASVLRAACEGPGHAAWPSVKLGEIASTIRNGYSHKPDAEAGTRILRISAIRRMYLDADDVRFLRGHESGYRQFLIEPGDVLFTRYNGSRNLVGVCAMVPFGMPPTVHPDKLIRVRVPAEVLLPKMLAILASTGVARAFLESRIRTTAGQSGISGADLKAVPLRVPPLSTQHRIVAEVEHCLSIVEKLEVTVAANLKRAELLRHAVLADAFSN